VHRVRHRRPQRHPADQPLAAPRSPRGDGVRAGPGAPRRQGAAVADPDDLAGHGPGPGAAGGPRRASRARDRAPARGGGAGRARHVHAAEPPHRPVPLPAVRPEPGRTPTRELDMYVARRLRSITVIAALGASPLAMLAAPGGGGTAPPAAASAAAATRQVAFPHPPRVNNGLFPLVPGTQFSYQGRIVQGGESTPHSVVFTVTGLTKMVGGVRTVVAWDRDFLDGKLEEQEIALFAQDSRGNVW